MYTQTGGRSRDKRELYYEFCQRIRRNEQEDRFERRRYSMDVRESRNKRRVYRNRREGLGGGIQRKLQRGKVYV